MRAGVAIAVLGGILFATGLIGTVLSSSAAQNQDPDYIIDCLGGSPAPDCDARRAAIERANAIVLPFEIVGIAGFLLILTGAVVDTVRKRGGNRSREKTE